jgi:hypothetical protein
VVKVDVRFHSVPAKDRRESQDILFRRGVYSREAQKNQGEIVMAKALAKLTFGVGALAATTWFGTSPSQAYGNAPWCAVTSIWGDVYWDCQYRTLEECVPNVIAGNRGFCNLNPWPGPPQGASYRYPKRHTGSY